MACGPAHVQVNKLTISVTGFAKEASPSPIPIDIVVDPANVPDQLLTNSLGFPPVQYQVEGLSAFVSNDLVRAFKRSFKEVNVIRSRADAKPGNRVVVVPKVSRVYLEEARRPTLREPNGTVFGGMDWSVSFYRPGQDKAVYEYIDRVRGQRAYGPKSAITTLLEQAIDNFYREMDVAVHKTAKAP